MSEHDDTNSNGDSDSTPERPCPLCGSEAHLQLKPESGFYKYHWYCNDCIWSSPGGRGPTPDGHEEMSHERMMNRAAELADTEAKERFREGYDIPRGMEIEYHHRRGATIRWECDSPWCDNEIEARFSPDECSDCGTSGFEATIEK